jgi:hypothetical protein
MIGHSAGEVKMGDRVVARSPALRGDEAIAYDSPMMKRTMFLLFAAAVILAAGFGQAPPAGRKLATLGPDEYIVTNESVLLTGGAAGCLADDYFLVTEARRSGKNAFYTYDKTGRKGPFDKMTESMLRNCGGDTEAHKFYLDNGMSPEGLEMGPDPANRRLQFVTFNGKKIGPFQQILMAAAAPDKSRAFAVGVRDKILHFASTDGRDVAAAGIPEKLVFNADGSKAVLLCKGHITLYEGMDIKAENMDLSSLEDTTLYALDGKKYGPFKKNTDFGDVWFLAGSPDWLFTVGPTAYFNGVPLKPFAEQIGKSSFWIDDASRYAWLEDDKLKFSDGASFPNPVMLRWEKKAGRTTLCWISLLPNRDVVAYSRGI